MGTGVAVQYGLFLIVAAPITFFDLRDYRIPDLLTLGGIALLVALQLALGLSSPGMIALELCLGYGSFWLIHRVTKGGMGLGDAKFSALIAVAVGPLPWVLALLAASLAGLLCAAVLILLLHRDRRVRIPFAPFMTIGAIVAVVAGPSLARLGL